MANINPLDSKYPDNLTIDSNPFDSVQDETNRVFPVIQEEATVEKRVVETGKVIISKKLSEHEEIVDVPLFHEKVEVERVPINQVIAERPAVRQEGEIMIIPVVQEQVFYQKRLVLIEELRVRKQVVEVHQPQKITLSREDVEIKRSAENENPVDTGNRAK